MCLYPKLISNPKYKPNKKNGGVVPIVCDERVKLVPIGCGKCLECKKKKANGWSCRLKEEIRNDNTGLFVTLTFSNESIREIVKDIVGLNGYELDNEIATIAVRRFLERWRWEYGKSVKHWLITELGHKGTENIHLHGVIWCNAEQKKNLAEIWKYGYVYKGYSMGERAINYVVKYCLKTDIKHKEYNQKIFCSKGIGNGFKNRPVIRNHEFKNEPGKTKEYYRDDAGYKKALPIYYRNMVFTEDQREILWLEKLDKMERYVLGSRIDVSKDYIEYDRALKTAREKNNRLGYGDDSKNWDRIAYENNRRKIMYEKRLKDEKNIN